MGCSYSYAKVHVIDVKIYRYIKLSVNFTGKYIRKILQYVSEVFQAGSAFLSENGLSILSISDLDPSWL